MKHQPTRPSPPDAWLVVSEQAVLCSASGKARVRSGMGAFPARDDPDLLAYLQECRTNPQPERFGVVLDHPSLDVVYSGLPISNPSWLTARDNWFHRYEAILEKHLRDPRMAQVYTYSRGDLPDPLTSHKSSALGPCPLPRGTPWPVCGLCGHRMAFLGVLDFRKYEGIPVPGSSLVLHVCKEECWYHYDPKAWFLTWLRQNDAMEIQGKCDGDVYVGTRWFVTEYPTPAFYAEELAGDELQSAGSFLDESGIYFNFTCLADKVGGHVFWIQQEELPTDSRGQPMIYIGQLTGSQDVQLGDGGIICVFYSPETGETGMTLQFF